jgi:hypothetical protein
MAPIEAAGKYRQEGKTYAWNPNSFQGLMLIQVL